MNVTRSLICLATFAFVLLPPGALAQSGECWSYLDLHSPCSGPNGCESDYTYSICIVGCVHGACHNNGGGGECCGVKYNSAVIYPDGDGSCHGGECGDAVGRIHISSNPIPKQNSESRSIYLTQGALYRVSGLYYVPDRCAHKYVVSAEDTSLERLGGL